MTGHHIRKASRPMGLLLTHWPTYTELLRPVMSSIWPHHSVSYWVSAKLCPNQVMEFNPKTVITLVISPLFGLFCSNWTKPGMYWNVNPNDSLSVLNGWVKVHVPLMENNSVIELCLASMTEAATWSCVTDNWKHGEAKYIGTAADLPCVRT